MTQPQMVRITGKDDQEYFVAYQRDDIMGEYDFTVEGGSTQPLNETARRQQAISLMNAVAPLVGMVIDPTELAKYVLSYGFGVKNPEKFIMQQQPMPPEGTEGGEEAPPEEAGLAAPPPPMSMGGGAPPPAFEATGGVPPELISQLQGQMGLELGNMG